MIKSSTRSKLRVLLFFLVILLAGSPGIAQTRAYVNRNATGLNDGTSWTNAYNELADALKWAKQNSVHWSDESPLQIWVAAGTYKPLYSPTDAHFGTPKGRGNSFLLVNNVQLFGGFSGNETSLNQRNWNTNKTILSADLGGNGNDTEKAYQVIFGVNIPSAQNLIDGFTVTGAYGYNTVVQSVNGQTVEPYNAGGMYLLLSNIRISNMIFTGNKTAYKGGGIYSINSNSVISNTLFTNNQAMSTGAAFFSSGSTSIFTNVTIAGNEGMPDVGINDNSGTQFRNSVIWGKYTGFVGSRSQVSFYNSLVKGLAASEALGNLSGSLDPQFNAAAAGDFSLKPTSPLIDRGSNLFYATGQNPDLAAYNKDLAGNRRFRGGVIDIGAYESQAIQIVPDANNILYVNHNVSGGNQSGDSWANAVPALADALKWAREQNNFTDVDPLKVYVAKGTYKPMFNAADGLFTTDGGRDNAFVLVNNVQLFGGFDPENNIVALTDNRVLPGRNGNNPGSTILSGDIGTAGTSADNAYHVVIAADAMGKAKLDGFAITEGYANGTTTITVNTQEILPFVGAGMNTVVSNHVLANISIHGNTATSSTREAFGGGMYNFNSSLVLTSVDIRDNTVLSYSASGGGMYNENSNLVLTNVAISGNIASGYTDYAHGGGVFNSGSDLLLTNVTLANNVAKGRNVAFSYGGAIYNYGKSTCKIYNSIIWGNSKFNDTSSDIGIFDYNSATIVVNSITQTYNTNNISDNNLVGTDPLFTNPAAGDYSLQPNSLAINAGNNTFYTDEDKGNGNLTTDTDLAGNPRLFGEHIDMGAYENQTKLVYPVRYVKQNATGAGTSWEDASGDLQKMIDAQEVEQVWVAAGEYQPATGASFKMTEGVKIYGGFPASGSPAFEDRNFAVNITTLKGNGASVIRNIDNKLTRAALLDGFTVTGGNNTAQDGGGIANWHASPSFYNLKIIGNTGHDGGGMYNGYADVLVVNSEISGNTASSRAGGVVNSRSSNPTFINVTVAGNTGAATTGAVWNDRGSSSFTNSIVYGNVVGKGIVNEEGVTTLSYSLVENIPSEPSSRVLDGTKTYSGLFMDAAAGDYRIQALSPVVNSGNNDAYALNQETNRDLSGRPRIFGERIDLGAYESQTEANVSIRYVREGFAGNGYSWEMASGDLQAMINESLSGQQIWVAKGTYLPNRKATDPATVTPNQRHNSFLLKDGVVVYGGFTGEETALEQRNWNENPTVLSGQLDGANSYHVVLAAGTQGQPITGSTKLDGFTITGGRADTYDNMTVHGETIVSANGGGIYNKYASVEYANLVVRNNGSSNIGGGIHNWHSNPIFRNIVAQSNTGSSGGGVGNLESSPVFLSARISGNSASYGGGVYNYNGSPQLSGVLINGNSATYGGALYNAGTTLTLTNATIAANTNYAIYNTSATATVQLRNSVVYGNENGVYSGTMTYHNSLVTGVSGGANGNLDGDIDPMFVQLPSPSITTDGDFTFHNCSPLINTGNADYLPFELTTDLNENRRIRQGQVDIGAYEWISEVSTGASRLSRHADTRTFTIDEDENYRVKVVGDDCRDIAVLRPEGDSPVTGDVAFTTWIDGAVQAHNGSPYVQRHYEVASVSSPENATASLTLFFTKAEFEAYNNAGSGKLPAYPDDVAGKSNLRIYQYHGTPAGGNSPGNYTGQPITINPADENIFWNSALERWEVTFSIAGFSGFFVGTYDTPLPVKLVTFKGKQLEDGVTQLEWTVAEQVGIDRYEVEFSQDAMRFVLIGSVPARAEGATVYDYRDVRSFDNSTGYYRLRMVEADGSNSFSKIISVQSGIKREVIVYPVPAKEIIWIRGESLAGSEIQVISKTGLIQRTVRVTSKKHPIDLSGLPTGIYIIRTSTGFVTSFIKE